MRMKKALINPDVTMVLYILLLIMTPFLMLMNYLQQFIGDFSKLSFSLGPVNIPYSVSIVVVVLTATLIAFRKQITPLKLLFSLITIGLFFVGQQMSDWYFNHTYYDLQHNWHYVAYGIFAFIAYRAFRRKGYSETKIIYLTFITAIIASSFDEFVQVYISSRIFDVSDIAKDTFGVCVGLFFLHFVLKDRFILKNRVEVKTLKEYLHQPIPALRVCFIFAFVMLALSSLLTDEKYVVHNFVGSIIVSSIIVYLVYACRNKIVRYVTLGLLILICLSGIISYQLNKDYGVMQAKYGFTVYRGIPIPFFDIFIFEDGSFRLVDKKHSFNARDRNKILFEASDIVIIGAGYKNKGGKGFNLERKSGFIYNTDKKMGTQFIIQRTDKAVETYNKLRREGKNVTFVIHTTC